MGKSTSAPAPDPRLQEATIEGLTSQRDIGRRMLANAEELAPIQKEQLRLGLDATKTAYEQSQADREYALGKRAQYDAALQPMINEAQQFDEAVRRNELSVQSKADISAAFGQAQEQQQRGMERAGINPVSGRAILAGQQGELAEAAARSRAGLAVTEAAKAEGLQLRGNIVNALKGAPVQAASLTPTGAQLGVGGLDAANAGLGGMNTALGAAGKQVGAAGQSAADIWKGQADSYYKTQALEDKETASIAGGLVGIGGSLGYKGYKDYTGKKGWFAA